MLQKGRLLQNTYYLISRQGSVIQATPSPLLPTTRFLSNQPSLRPVYVTHCAVGETPNEGGGKLGVVQSMSVQQLAEIMLNPEEVEEHRLVDVREEDEFHMARLPHFHLLPCSQANQWMETALNTWDREEPVVVMCHAGIRSNYVAQHLVDNGFTNVFNVLGGIDAWSTQVDSSVPRY